MNLPIKSIAELWITLPLYDFNLDEVRLDMLLKYAFSPNLEVLVLGNINFNQQRKFGQALKAQIEKMEQNSILKEIWLLNCWVCWEDYPTKFNKGNKNLCLAFPGCGLSKVDDVVEIAKQLKDWDLTLNLSMNSLCENSIKKLHQEYRAHLKNIKALYLSNNKVSES